MTSSGEGDGRAGCWKPKKSQSTEKGITDDDGKVMDGRVSVTIGLVIGRPIFLASHPNEEMDH